MNWNSPIPNVLGGMSWVTPKPVKASNNPIVMPFRIQKIYKWSDNQSQANGLVPPGFSLAAQTLAAQLVSHE